MPLLNFQKRFAGKVEIGLSDPTHPEAKRQTIRARRKDCRNPQPGQTLYLYTGLRTKSSRKLGEATCTESTPIEINERGSIVAGLYALNAAESEAIAKKDGFEDYPSFIDFFRKTHELPFYGFLIKW